MDVRRPREATREPFDPRDLEISRLKREVSILRGREESARAEAQDARKHFAHLTSMSKRFAHSMRATVGERQQQRRRLAAQYAVSKVLAEARDLDEAAPKIYEVLGERLGWQAGALWKVDEDPDGSRVLRRAGHWRSEGSPSGALEEAGEGTVFRRGEGLPGKVWERCEPVWIEDLVAEKNIPRKAAAVEDGLRGALAFPIVDGGFVGVFEFFRHEILPPDQDLMRTAALVGGQISQFLERRHAEEERDRALVREREAHERTTGILDSINDAFFTLDAERRFVYVNSRTEEFLGKTREELLGRKIWEAYPEVVGSESYRATEEALELGKAAEFEEVSSVLGIWASVRVYPSADGVSVLFHSIEERKRAEETSAWSARLRALHADVRAEFAWGGDMDGILQRCTESMVEHLGVSFARVWLFDEADEVLNLRASAGMYARLDGRYGRVGLDDHEIGRIAEERRPHLTNEVGDDPRIEDGEWARREGMVAFAGYPMIVEGRLVGVAAVFARRALTQETLETIASVSDAMAQGIGREQAEDALRQSRERAVYRTTLADALRPLDDPAEIQEEAARALGRHLGASRVHYAEVTEDGEHVVIDREYADGVSRLTGEFRVEEFDASVLDRLREGRTSVRRDVAGSPELSEAEKRACAGVSVGAHVEVPLVKDGRLVAVLCVHASGPRAWTEAEAALVEETAERMWHAIERARAEKALRESEKRYRTLFESIDEGFCTVEVLFDEDGKPFDCRFRETNPAFEKQTGMTGVAGTTARELVPDLEDGWFEAYGRVALTGEAVRFENRAEGMDRWFEVYAYRVGGPDSRTVGILFKDVTQRKLAAEVLRENEARLSAIFSQAAVGLCEISPDGSFVRVNDELCRILGRPREEILATNAREATHPDNLAETVAKLGRLMETGEPFSLDKQYLRPDGTAVWANSTLTRLDDEGGSPRGALAVVVDLTERKRAEEALRQSENRLQQAIAIETVGVIFFEADGSVTQSNDAFLRMSGYDRDDLEAGLVRWDGMTPPEYMPQSLQALDDFRTLGRLEPYEKEYIRKDGSRWWALFAATRLDGGDGAEFVVDITEAKRAEEALRQSEERFRAIADLVPDLLWSNDPSGATGWYNQRWFEYTGRGLVEDEAYDWLDAVHPDDREASQQAFVASLDSGEPLRLEHRIRGRDGAYRWFLLRSRPVYDDGGRIVRWFGAATDIHEQRAALEALRESEGRYRSLAEATSSIVWTGDKNGAIVEEIPAWEEFTGQTYSEYKGFGWLDALHPADRPPDSLWGEMMAAKPESIEEEFRLRRRSGEYRRIVIRGVPIVDEAGETREWVGTVFDVEDHRRTEEEREGLRRAAEWERARLETILQQMPGGVFIADVSGRFVLASDGGRRIYGSEIGSADECARHSRSYPDGQETALESWPLARALRGEAVSSMEYYVVRPDGTRRIVRANAAPVFDEEGNVVAAVKVFEDVTGRKEAEEERDRSLMREREARDAAEEAERRLAFYAGAREERQVISRELHDRVAHSIAVVRQNLELYEVLRDRNPEAAAKKMELAKAEAKVSLKSTRDLSMMLRRSEVEGGLANALAGLEETTIPMGVYYESTVTGDEGLVPPHIGNQIFLVLREAVRNAINHSDCARVRVRLEITEEGVIGTVEDDGRGFDPDVAHAGGGLRSMEERASLVGGKFWFRCAPDGGTRIEVSVPLRRTNT